MNELIWLGAIQCFLLDMDGTFYLDNQLLPGAKDFIDYCNRKQKKYLFVTNNSSKNAKNYVEKLNRLGIPVNEDRIITSGEATCIYLEKHYPGQRVFLAGTPALIQELDSQGVQLVEEKPDVIVLGFDTTINYDKLWMLCDWVREGLPYIATHPDINCPVHDGFMPDIGAMIAFIAASTNRNPDVIIGKPFTPMVEAIQQRINLPIENICMIGDRLYTDIAMGRTGIKTILVLSGETSREQASLSEFIADFVVEGLQDLLTYLDQ